MVRALRRPVPDLQRVLWRRARLQGRYHRVLQSLVSGKAWRRPGHSLPVRALCQREYVSGRAVERLLFGGGQRHVRLGSTHLG